MDRYEEALAKARAGKSLEEIFPEMKESEDERIRKHLIEIVETYWGKTNEPGKAADLAWLEKQKEQPTNEEMLRTLRAEYEKGVADTIAKYEEKEQKSVEWSKEDDEMRINILQEIANIKDAFPKINIQPEFDWLKSLPERFNLRSKQEWSEDYNEEKIQTRFAFYTYKDDPSVLYLSNVFVEETSRNHGFGTRILRAAEKVAETIGATTISLKVKQNSPANAWYRKNGYGYVAFEDGYDWLEKNLEYMKPDKSVEWSEKEMKLTISAIEYYYDAENPIRDKLIHWLKSLRPQPKQEWSEEDDKTLNRIINVLDTLGYEEYCTSSRDQDVEEERLYYNEIQVLKKLKSLRPPQYCENCKLKRSVENWKPSKEQMGMLLAVINDPNNAGAESCHLMLQSLFADLKKL